MESSVNVSLKWGKIMYNDIKINLPPNLELIQAQIYSLTGVPPERQKLLHKGCHIKDFKETILSEGMLIYLIGSRNVKECLNISNLEHNVDNKTSPTLTPEDVLPPIIKNLGNTCYLNATIQLLRCIPELRDILKGYKELKNESEDSYSLSYSLSGSLKDLFRDLDNASIDDIVSPTMFLYVLQLVEPSFNERDKNGLLRQQDANECLSVIIRMLQSELQTLNEPKNPPRSFIDRYLTGQFEITTKCIENNEFSTFNEPFLQLTCFISQEVKYMSTGIRMSLDGEINKFSETLQKDTAYTQKYLISRLPSYLVVNFLRFFYKEKVKMNAKILREVKFPLVFDAYEFCTDKLKENLNPMRENYRKEEDYLAHNKVTVSSKIQKTEYGTYPHSFEYDSGSNNSGYYQLQAVVTHKGRTSQAGHYIAWVKMQASEKNLWVKVDDDIRFTGINEEEILKLAGGSDNHTAYLLLYGPQILKKNIP